jgi:HK97 family phage major capsid protein/HK97 family phage prohead protease
MLAHEYAVLHVKAIDEGARTFSGIATTPTMDRQGDILEPLGVKFSNPVPLLFHHDHERPIGHAMLGTPTAEGIPFTATIPTVFEAGPLRDRLDEAWGSVKAGIIRGVSIGYRILKDGAALLKAPGRLHLKATEIFELSLVTIPANVEATILAIKSLDAPILAASGPHVSGVADPLPVVRVKVSPPMAEQTYAEKITALENKRAATLGALNEIQTKAEGRTKEADEKEKFDGLTLEIKSIDAELADLRALEALNAAAAKPVAVVTSGAKGLEVRNGVTVQVTSPLPKGTAFTRYCMAKIVGKGSNADAIEHAKMWRDSTPEVELALKAAVAPGTSTDATWAGPLAPLTPLANEFLELLRPATILGKIPGFRRVPFNVSIASQTGGGSYAWVGQGAPKPVGKLAFLAVTLGITKCAGIIVITEELARVSTPSAEAVIRQDMIAGIAQFLDTEFTDPTKAAVAGISPGSVTNGVTPITTAGPTPANARTDVQALANAMTVATIPIGGAVVLMSATNMLALASSLNALGQPLFPSIGVEGGSALGFTFVPSQSMGTTVAMIQPDAILYADDGGVTIDVSREASVQMDSAPDNPALATTVLTSLWQNNLVGLRAERFINWKKARPGCVQYTVATYTA